MYTLTDVTKDPINFDVVIIGGGPAGMSAALWCADLTLSCCLIHARAELGGQLHHIYNPIGNYLGTRFESGAECSRRFKDSLEGLPIDVYRNSIVTAIDPSTMTVSTEHGNSFKGKAIVIATGLRRRDLGVPGESEFSGKGILDSGARDPEQVRGHRVAVIGGGDAALENALILSDRAEHVYLIHRRDSFSAREQFISSATSRENIELVLDSTVSRFGGESELSFVKLQDDAGSSSRLDVTRAIVRIGFQPNSEFVRGILDLDEEGYISVDAVGKTSREGVYAAGDVACKLSPTIATAIGSAATSIKSIEKLIRTLE